MNRTDPKIEQIIQAKRELRDILLQHYFERELFSWVWWIGVLGIIASFVIWIIVLDKKRTLEICVYGLLVNISAVFLDVIGSEYALWEYSIRTLPIVPLLFPVDMVWMPIAYMLIYQKCTRWPGYLLSIAVAALFFSFVMEPVAVAVGQYRLLEWKYVYSLPIYYVIACLAKATVGRMKKIEGKI